MGREHHRLRGLEGRTVSVALKDGTRIDGCDLVSIGRNGAPTLWLFINGEDTFVPLDDVIDLWENARFSSRPRSGG